MTLHGPVGGGVVGAGVVGFRVVGAGAVAGGLVFAEELFPEEDSGVSSEPDPPAFLEPLLMIASTSTPVVVC